MSDSVLVAYPFTHNFQRQLFRQEWVEQPVHKEIGEAVAKLYRESRAEGSTKAIICQSVDERNDLLIVLYGPYFLDIWKRSNACDD